jgi:hypothetical protein
VITIDPRPMPSAKSWCDQVTPLLEQFGYIPRLTDDSQWQLWAIRIQGLPKISAKNPPNPNLFPDWKSWAMRFNQCLSG